jgi:phosphate/sulfate permease
MNEVIKETNKSNPSVISVIQAGLVLGATLAWSEVVKTGTKQLYPADENKLFQAQLIYAIIITILLVIGFQILRKAEKNLNHIKNKIDEKIKDIEHMVSK